MSKTPHRQASRLRIFQNLVSYLYNILGIIRQVLYIQFNLNCIKATLENWTFLVSCIMTMAIKQLAQSQNVCL